MAGFDSLSLFLFSFFSLSLSPSSPLPSFSALKIGFSPRRVMLIVGVGRFLQIFSIDLESMELSPI